jgi:hypothetical protein
MGFFDFFRRPGANRDKVAIEIDLATGVIEECPVCRGLSDKQRDDRLPAADLEAHQRFDRNDPSVAVFQGDREDLLRRLRSVRDGVNYHCTCMDAG